MKRWNIYLILAPMVILAAGSLAGCYTQIGTVREDRPREEEYVYEEDQYADTVAQEEYYGYDDARDRFYYDYYYPRVGLGFGYSDPWYGSYYGYYDPYYSSYYYDPIWGWCGTAYPSYYASWRYRTFPGYGWHTPGVYTYRVGNSVTVREGGPYGATRTFGATRTSGSTGSGGAALPVGRTYRPGTNPGSSQPASIPRVSSGGRGSERPARVGSSPDRSGSTGRSGSREGVRSERPRTAPARSSGERSGVRRYQPGNSPPPSPSPNSGNSGGSPGRSGGGQSYSPPPPPPPSSPPPPSNTGQAPANTGRRGSERRD